MPMVMTILESHVAPDRQAALQAVYERETAQLDAGIEQTFLSRSNADPTLWRILTVWRDREALDAMRASGQTPRGVLIFREAGAEPSLTVHSIVAQRSIAASRAGQ